MSRPLVALSTTLIGLFGLLPLSLDAADWSRFRGPNGSGVSSYEGLPVSFGANEGVVWVTEVPFGRSSPVLSSDRVFLTAVEEGKHNTKALDAASGELVWERGIERVRDADLYHGTDSASATPATDGSNVYAFFHEAGIVSYSADGEERWRHEMGPFRNFYGIAASPIVNGGLVYMVADQVGGSFVVALDSTSGEEVWRQPRPARPESYATPVLYPDAASPRLLLVLGSSFIDAYDPRTGEVRWSKPGVGVGPVASPALEGNLLVVSAPDQAPEPMTPFADLLKERDKDGDGKLSREDVEDFWMQNHFGFVDADGDGFITAADYARLEAEMPSDSWGIFGVRLDGADAEPEILWNVRQSVPYIPSPLIYGGAAWVLKDSILTTLDPESGEVLKRGRLAQGKVGTNASPIGADGKVYVATTDGKVAVLRAEGQWEVLALNDMEEPIHATPAIDEGDLFVRTESRLYRLTAAAPSSDGP